MAMIGRGDYVFIYCFDEELKNKLIQQNYKMINKPNNQNYWVFINNKKKLDFDFTDVDTSKFKLSNKLNF